MKLENDGFESVRESWFKANSWPGLKRRTPQRGRQKATSTLLVTPFELEGERFLCTDSFYEALKLPEGTSERALCAMASSIDARRLARRTRGETFLYRGERISVSSREHESLLAAAICANIDQNAAVQVALAETDAARLTFPLTFNNEPGSLGRVTPLTLMIERWKRRRSKLGPDSFGLSVTSARVAHLLRPVS